ncbi:MAG TPA: dynamin family protein [Gemmatimonadales bacterium]|nr:dynamin family protein [Gemmatimonadales bacterium]
MDTRPAPLAALARLARAAGCAEIADDAEQLADRTAAGRFYVACVGQFKRGKSTLINALLDTDALPVGVPPVTSVPTVVRWGERAARVFQSGRWRPIDPGDIREYVTQEHNPDNTRRVTGIELCLPHPLLEDGLCLVDTPGLGSVFDANAAATREFLPHIDAAIVVLGADPPISGDELRFTVELAQQVDILLFVLSKADRVPEADRAQAVAFAERVLAGALGRPVGPVYEVSATLRDRGPAASNGWRALVSALHNLPETKGQAVVQSAARRGVERLARRLEATLLEERRALLAPLEESDRHLAALTELAEGARHARRTLEPLLAAEEQELARQFERRRVEFLERAVPAAHGELERRWTPHLRRAEGLELAHSIARDRLTGWLEESEREAQAAYVRVVSRFAALAREFLERAAAAAELPGTAVQADDATWGEFQEPRGFYFTSLLSYHLSPFPWAGLADALTPNFLAHPRRRKAAHRYLEHLLAVNAIRVESDLRNRVSESRIRVARTLDGLLGMVGGSAVRALERGRAARARGESATREAVARVNALLAQVAALLGSLENGSAPAA